MCIICKMSSGFDMFQNTGYNNNRNKIKTLILDVQDGVIDIEGGTTTVTHLSNASEFNIELFEPLIIDKPSTVYLDHFITYNCNISGEPNSLAFCLHINEFNIQTNVSSEDDTDKNNIYGSIVIPNENNSTANYFAALVHKGKKFNYICDINPSTISNLSGTITNLSGGSAFHGTTKGAEVYTYAIQGITTWAGGAATVISAGEPITNITITVGGTTGEKTTGATVLVTSLWGTTILVFTSTDGTIDPDDWRGATAFTLIVTPEGESARATYTISGTSLHLTKQNARFIAEFTIIAKD